MRRLHGDRRCVPTTKTTRPSIAVPIQGIASGSARISSRLSQNFAHCCGAEKVAREIRERLSRTDLGLPTRDRESFRTYAERWLLAIASTLKASTVRFYRDNLKNHLLPVIGLIPLQRITRDHVRDLIIALTAKSLRPKTITGIVRTLSTMLSEAVESRRVAA